jgi:Pentapeptide repeats (8 copies)
MLYLAIATGTTTHRMLFLESPLNLPVLNIALPLLGFYILTPIIFVVFHFYMLLNLVLLARTAKSFEDALVRAFPDDGEPRETFRRIENTLFVQLLVGAKPEREGCNAKLLSLMALITLALAPVALLLMIQIKFLPYHSEWITWLHRGLLALDLGLVWTLWPGYRSGWGVIRLWPKWSWWLGWTGMALAYAVVVATFPDEHMYLARLHGIAPVNTLKLHGEDLIDDAKLAHILEKNESSSDEPRWVASFSASDRDLTGADLGDADVRHVDFSGAILNRAHLDRAWAENAHFVYAELQGASIWTAQLRGALLDHAQLQGAALLNAQLQGTSLDDAHFEAASLDSAGLQARRSIMYISRAHRSIVQVSRVRRSSAQSSMALRSGMCSSGGPTLVRQIGRTPESLVQKLAPKGDVTNLASHHQVTIN